MKFTLLVTVMLSMVLMALTSLSLAQGCVAIAGDANGDGKVDLADIVFNVNHVFKNGPAPSPLCRGDNNADGKINLVDIIYEVYHIFKGGPGSQISDVCCLPEACPQGIDTLHTSISAIFPPIIPTNTPVLVTIITAMTEPDFVPEEITLWRGKTNLGMLRDDGTGGDAVANDSIFTIQKEFLASSVGPIFVNLKVRFKDMAEEFCSRLYFLPVVDKAVICPESVVVTLNDSGTYRLPDFAGNAQEVGIIINQGIFPNGAVVTQNPPAGTVFVGPTVIFVNIVVSDEIGTKDSCFIFIQTLDRHEPQVTIWGVNPGEKFIPPVEVIPIIEAVDETDPAPVITALLDGEPYIPGTPISEVGLHVVRAYATDASGNVGEAIPLLFEILPRPLFGAVAVTTDLSCSEDESTGFATVDVTILLATDEFSELDLNLYTVNLWVLNQNSFPLNRKLIPIAGSIDSVTGGYNYAGAQALYQEGYWTLHFTAQLQDSAIIGCPTYLLLTGGGNRGDSNSFDFEALTEAAVNPDPLDTLGKLGLLNNDPIATAAPEPECPTTCGWKWRYNAGGEPDKTTLGGGSACFGGGWQVRNVKIWAQYGRFGGSAEAIDDCPGNASGAASAGRGSFLIVSREGPPECCGCKIIGIFKPRFKAKAHVEGGSHAALATGVIDIASNLGRNVRAVGGVEADKKDGTELTFECGASVGKDGPGPNCSAGIKYKTTVNDRDDINETIDDNAVMTSNECLAIVSVFGKGRLDVNADAWYPVGHSEAMAYLDSTFLDIFLETTCEKGPCAGSVNTTTLK